jgi:RNA-binding protein
LKGFQKRYLRGLAHSLQPVVFIGQKGLTDALIRSTEEALDTHELIKVKFNDFKEKEQKQDISEKIGKATDSEMVGLVGHIAAFYRPHKDPEKRKIVVPEKSHENHKKA